MWNLHLISYWCSCCGMWKRCRDRSMYNLTFCLCYHSYLHGCFLCHPHNLLEWILELPSLQLLTFNLKCVLYFHTTTTVWNEAVWVCVPYTIIHHCTLNSPLFQYKGDGCFSTFWELSMPAAMEFIDVASLWSNFSNCGHPQLAQRSLRMYSGDSYCGLPVLLSSLLHWLMTVLVLYPWGLHHFTR